MSKCLLSLLLLALLLASSVAPYSAAQEAPATSTAILDYQVANLFPTEQLASPTSVGVRQIAAGGDHTCALTNQGTVKCWGSPHADHPVDIAGLSNVRRISAGGFHDCALLQTGAVQCWGRNWWGQLGDGTTEPTETPVAVSGLSSGVVALASGERHTCALTISGLVKCWGDNSSGQFGDGTTNWSPTPVNSRLTNASAIAAGDKHTCAATRTGGAMCWGLNSDGQLGDGTAISRSAPVGVSGLESGVRAIAAATEHTCVVMDSGGVQCWGRNSTGQLGIGLIGGPDGDWRDAYYRPVQLPALSRAVTAVTGGSGISGGFSFPVMHSCALVDTGAVKCWGFNGSGQLGDGTKTYRPDPVSVAGLGGGALSIAVGEAHSCVVTSAGGVKCWGRNNEGQLGRGGFPADTLVPVDVPGLGGGPVDAAELASQSEYLTVTPGASVNFWINVRNTGTTTWRASDGYGWRGDDEWLGDSGPVTGETPPGGIWRRETTFTAPTVPGEYVYGFMMRHGTQEFGPYFFVRVTVISSPDTGFRANPNGFASANRQLYRSWEMFKQFFGATNVEKPDKNPCAAAQAYFDKNYLAVAGGYSCVGFSATSMISYLGSSQPHAGSYAIASYSRLFDEQWSMALSEPIKYYAGSQLSKQYELEAYQWFDTCDSDPFGVVERIRQSLKDRNPLLLTLRADLAGGEYAHTIAPYNLVDVSPTEAHAYVYDSDAPGNNAKFIRFTRDATGWQWDYTFVGSLNGATQPSDGTDCKNMWAVKLSTMLQQGEPSEAWCSASTTQNALRQEHEPSAMSGTASGRVLVSFPADGDSFIRDASGRRLGWVGGQAVSEIPGAYPLLQDSAPGYAARRGAHAPAGQYSVESSPQSTGKIDSAVFGDGRVIMIEGAVSTATTMQVTSGLDSATITNPAAFTSFVTTLIEEQSLSSTVAVVSVTQPIGTSPVALQSSGNQVTLSRAADTLNYTLAYRNSGALDFVSSQVALGANESHNLAYDGSTVLLQIDRGRNGTIDETRTLANMVKRVYLPMIKR